MNGNQLQLFIERYNTFMVNAENVFVIILIIIFIGAAIGYAVSVAKRKQVEEIEAKHSHKEFVEQKQEETASSYELEQYIDDITRDNS